MINLYLAKQYSHVMTPVKTKNWASEAKLPGKVISWFVTSGPNLTSQGGLGWNLYGGLWSILNKVNVYL